MNSTETWLTVIYVGLKIWGVQIKTITHVKSMTHTKLIFKLQMNGVLWLSLSHVFIYVGLWLVCLISRLTEWFNLLSAECNKKLLFKYFRYREFFEDYL